jgi:hypothetical protein
VADDFAARYAGLLAGSYDCVDRIVLNAYYPMGNTAGGFRTWWRRLIGGPDAEADAVLDNTHLMRLAGRFARRVRAWAADNAVPVIDCKAGERKHLIAEEYLRTHSVGPGVFLVLVSKAPAMVWDVRRSADGAVVGNLARKRTYVNHYSFHIMDRQWGHLTIKMAGHAPFGAQVLLNGHEYVAVAAHAEGIGFVKEGNCFTGTTDPGGLAQIADTLSQDAAAGRLSQVINRWIYTACLVFGLDLADQQRTCFRYAYSVYQVEYSRNLLFACGRQMQDVFDAVVDRTRSRLDVPQVTTLFGAKMRPRTARGRRPPRLEVAIETPAYDLTKFKVHFGNLTLKGYTKGERVLRFEGIAHNTKDLRCGRTLDKFAPIVTRLKQMVEEFCTALDCVDVGFIPDGLLDALPAASQLGGTRTGGIDVNKPRSRAVLAAALALAIAPGGFTVADFTAKVRTMTGQAGYTSRNAAYDLRKLRGKHLADKPGRTRRYLISPGAARIISALLTLREHVIAPLLAGVADPRIRRTPRHWTEIDRHYQALRLEMMALFADIGIACG